MSYFLIFLAVMLAAAVAVYVVGLKKPDTGAAIYQDGLSEPVSGLPPVLLPERPAPADVDKLRFSLGLRGYRMDQVDEALDRLRDELAAKDARITALEASDGAAAPEALGAPVVVDLSEDAELPGPDSAQASA
ncbi:DivIVA domain-containing protein [Arthrobacter sp. GMC3]|uniref:DivIVA domain-containing protein n=1 Tax=Arthrobacter sp. GMC3 TaxID=2058894 RepID=UPI0021589BAB|nr:DivIVA domain-containing protein [Arthrobacter sp. GMC3]